jgi:twinkle protein
MNLAGLQEGILQLKNNSKPLRDRYHIPCPNPKCGSSDAYTEYDDGHGYCQSCKFYSRGESVSVETIKETTVATSLQFTTYRGISAGTNAFYGIQTEVTEDGTVVKRHYPYPWGGRKIRVTKDFTKKKDGDDFYVQGDMRRRGLFGRQLFDPGASKIITIVEGEEDAVSAFQMLNKNYPVVSVQSGSSAKEDCIADLQWLNQYDKIYLALDNDTVGRKAAKDIAGLFDYNKVFFVDFTRFKDANDYLKAGEVKAFNDVWYAAKRYAPKGVVSTWAGFRDILTAREGETLGSYPFKQLQDMARGFREGEIVLIDAPEGVGKTEIVRALEYHLLKSTDHNIGCIHLEESTARQIKGLAGLEIHKPVHFGGYTDEEIFSIVQGVTKRDDRLHLYSHYDNDDPDTVLDTIRFFVTACGCKFVFLDHITLVVTGMAGDDERKTLDYLSTKLAHMVEDHAFCLVIVSHVNDDGKTRGSRNIAKVADLRLSLQRDLEAENDEERNTTRLLVRKNRFGSITGPAGELMFDFKTFTVRDKAQFIKLPEVA